MPNELTAAALLQSAFARIDQEVDRIAMAYLEARLLELAQQRESDNRGKQERDGRFNEEWHKLRDTVLEREHGSLVHLVYWLDVRADYYARHRPPSKSATQVVDLLRRFAREAHHIQELAQQARQEAEGRGEDDADLYRNADALHSITELHRESH